MDEEMTTGEPSTMHKELEQRWVVVLKDMSILDGLPRIDIFQGFFERPFDDILRLRITDDVKAEYGHKVGIVDRDEEEFPTDLVSARRVLRLLDYLISKWRHFEGRWEINIYRNELAGVIIIEHERKLGAPLVQLHELPDYVAKAVEVTGILSDYHLARIAYDIRRMRNKQPILDIILPKRVPTLVLTGGPCSGKSTVLKALDREFGSLIHCVPEVATFLIGQVEITPDPSDHVAFTDFQQRLMRIQYDLECLAQTEALKRGKGLVVMDRGMRDSGAFFDGGWSEARTLISLPLPEDRLYTKVAIMDLPPTREIYEEHCRNNSSRRENYDEAREQDRRIRKAWSGHQEVLTVTGHDMSHKERVVLETVKRMLSA